MITFTARNLKPRTMIVIGYVAAIGAIIFIAIALFASIGVLSFFAWHNDHHWCYYSLYDGTSSANGQQWSP